MAIAAIQTEFPDMMFVAERNGLRPRVMHLGYIGGLIHDVYGVSQDRNQDHRAVNADARDGVRAAMKDLCHTCRPRGDTPRCTVWTVLAPLCRPQIGPQFIARNGALD